MSKEHRMKNRSVWVTAGIVAVGIVLACSS
jgi:hypothetical protein